MTLQVPWKSPYLQIGKYNLLVIINPVNAHKSNPITQEGTWTHIGKQVLQQVLEKKKGLAVVELPSSPWTLTGGMNSLHTKAGLNKQNRQTVMGYVEGSGRKKTKKEGFAVHGRPHKSSLATWGHVLSQTAHPPFTVAHTAARFKPNQRQQFQLLEVWLSPRTFLLTQSSCSFRPQIRFFFLANNLIRCPLKAAVTVSDGCQGDTAHGHSWSHGNHLLDWFY